MNNIAGVCDATGRIFALMPHPERHIRFTQHPQWTRKKTQGIRRWFRHLPECGEIRQEQVDTGIGESV